LTFRYTDGFPTLQSLAQLSQYKLLAQAGTTPDSAKFPAAPVTESSRAHIISAAVTQTIAALLAFWSGAV